MKTLKLVVAVAITIATVFSANAQLTGKQIVEKAYNSYWR